MMNFLASFLSALKPRYDDDVVDRLSYYYTCLIILILSITISAKQYVGQPIQCWVPAQFTGAWEQYAENYCFVQNTYWLPLNEYIPHDIYERENRQIGYYQWVPFILAIEALMFYMPCVVWRILNSQSGINIESIVNMAAESSNINAETRKKVVKTIARHIEEAIQLQRDFGQSGRLIDTALNCGKARGVYVTSLFIIVKLMYISNVIGQFFLLNAFVGAKYTLWGFGILQDLAHGAEWEESGHFPRVTMCDFEVRVLGNVHRHTIQCVLMINMFNEKIFVFLWWWFLLVAAASILSLIFWLFTALPSHKRESFIRKYLRVQDAISPNNQRQDNRSIEKFVTILLRPDGVFILRMLAYNAGDIAAAEVVEELWKSFKERYASVLKQNGQGKNSEENSLLLPQNEKDSQGFVETFYTSGATNV